MLKTILSPLPVSLIYVFREQNIIYADNFKVEKIMVKVFFMAYKKYVFNLSSALNIIQPGLVQQAVLYTDFLNFYHSSI